MDTTVLRYAATVALTILVWQGGCDRKNMEPAPGQAGTQPAAAAPAPAENVAAGSLRVVKSAKGGEDVEVFQGGKWVGLTNFPRPQILFARQQSPDGKYAFVWHHENPPRVLSIYDLTTAKLLHSFVPGHGGMLQWTPANAILHKWTGATASEYAIYDLQGKILLEGSASGVNISPGGRFLATYPASPNANEPLVILNLATLQTVYNSKGKADISFVDELEWKKDGLLVKYSDKADQDKDMIVPLTK